MNATVHDPAPSISGDAQLAELLEEVSCRLQSGEPVDIEAYAARYPDRIGEIRQLLSALVVLADLGRSSKPAISNPQQGAYGSDEDLTGMLGDYRILRELGRGGMGVVYEAEQISLGRRVALKVLPFTGTMNSKQLQRFKNESHNAASLDHPNIVRVYAVSCDRGVHFYAMQLIEGLTLAELLGELIRSKQAAKKPAARVVAPPISNQTTLDAVPVPDADADTAFTLRNPLADTGGFAALTTEHAKNPKGYFRRIAELGIQAADAIDYAHQMGIVHRDIKPGNLMMDVRGTLWITDFGLARNVADTGITMTGDLLGTLRYMSPEQALAQRVTLDHRTDVYSLGVTLYELLTLQPAFNGSDRAEVLKQIAFEEPKKPRSIDKRIPAELETIVLKAMEKRPEERYQTAKELAEDLRRWSEEKPIKAKPPGVVQKAGKWGRRNRPIVAAGVAVLFVVAVSLGVSTGMVLHQIKVKDEALMVAEQKTVEAEENAAKVDRERQRAEALLARSIQLARVGAEAKQPLVVQQQAIVALLEELVHLQPEQPAYRRQLLTAYVGLASAHYHDISNPSLSARARAAAKVMGELISRQSKLAAEFPNDRIIAGNYKYSRVSLYEQFGKYLREGGQLTDAADAFRQALEYQWLLWKELPGAGAANSYLSRLLDLGEVCFAKGQFAEAEELYQKAEALLDPNSDVGPSMAKLYGWYPTPGWLYRARADIYWERGKTTEATEYYRRTIDYFDKALERIGENAPFAAYDELAWQMVTCPIQKLRNPARAIELANQSIVFAQRRFLKDECLKARICLAVALLRAGSAQACLDVVREEIGSSRSCAGWFAKAMAFQQLGKNAEANKAFAYAAKWMETNTVSDLELHRFRTEAAGLLGIQGTSSKLIDAKR